MKAKERILSAIRGEATDKPAWSPFLAYWWESQPESVTRRGMISVLEEMGADPLLRGFGAAWTMEFSGLEQTESVKGHRKQTVWHTPVGDLVFGYRYSAEAKSWFLVDHPIEKGEDLKPLMWAYERARILPRPELKDELDEAGDRVLLLPILGSEYKTCFQSLVEKYAGTVNLSYILADEPEKVEECLDVMRSVSDKTAVFSAEAPADGFIFWEDSSTTNISPTFFAKYTAPEIAYWGNTLHAADKFLVHHACGHLRDLLPLMAELPIDAIESISPPPTGNIDIDEAFDKVPEHIALIGGIEPVFFETADDEELTLRVEGLLRIGKNRRYVLANSDSCPPGVAKNRFRTVSDIVSRWRR